MIATSERETYEQVWSQVEGYGVFAPGETYLPVFLDIVGAARGTVLDAGCGSGKGALALQRAGFTVGMCDLTNAGLTSEAQEIPFVQAVLWQDLRDVAHIVPRRMWNRDTVDWVYCCDVLEHIPIQYTMLVVDQLIRIAKRGVFLSIAFVPDNMGIWTGQALHKTVENFQWWRDSLKEIGEVVEARDLHKFGIFFVRSR